MVLACPCWRRSTWETYCLWSWGQRWSWKQFWHLVWASSVKSVGVAKQQRILPLQLLQRLLKLHVGWAKGQPQQTVVDQSHRLHRSTSKDSFAPNHLVRSERRWPRWARFIIRLGTQRHREREWLRQWRWARLDCRLIRPREVRRTFQWFVKCGRNWS